MDFNLTSERQLQYEELETQLSQRMLSLKSEGGRIENDMELKEERLEDLRKDLKQLKLQTSTLTRELLTVLFMFNSAIDSIFVLIYYFLISEWSSIMMTDLYLLTLQNNRLTTHYQLLAINYSLSTTLTIVVDYYSAD